MRKQILSALLIAALPAFSYATDIKITNNTDSYGTGEFNVLFKLCSSNLGNSGIIQPHQANFTLPNSVIRTYCGSKDCEAFLYETRDCSGAKIATVVLNANSGVVNINVHAKDRYEFSYNASSITISARQGFMTWLKSFF